MSGNKKFDKGLKNIFNGDLKELIKNVERNEEDNIVYVSLDKIIENPYQPRKKFNQKALEILANSIKENGLLSPILLRKDYSNERYHIIAGERRFRAFKINNEKFIPSIIKDVSNSKLEELALTENIMREGLNKLEESLAFKSILEKNNWTHDELANKINKSRSYVSNLLRIEKLDEKILEALILNRVSFGVIKMLINLEKEEQLNLFEKIINENLNARDVESLVNQFKNIEKNDEHYSNLLKQKVRLKGNKFIIEFNNENDLLKIKKLLNLE